MIADEDGLCSLCETMFGTFAGIRVLLSADGFTFYNRQDLGASAASGCSLCGWLLNVCTFRWSSWTDEETDPITVQFWDPWNKATPPAVGSSDDAGLLEYLREHRIHHIEVASPHHKGFIMQLYSLEGSVSTDFVPRSVNPHAIASEWTFTRLKSWLSECKDAHDQCARNHTSSLPKRVLDVGLDGDSTIRLYMPKKGERDEYVTLSYCWGGPQSLITTTETLKSRIQGVMLSILPQSILDAVTATRKLGYRYLWVDSLCIIQDSAEDTLQEIAAMGDIYENSAVTIVAANADKVDEGFLGERPPLDLLRLESCLGTLYIARNNKQYREHRPNDPLFSGGWTFQEFLLSPRVIMYDQFQVTWHCYEDSFRDLHSGFRQYSYGTKRNFTSMILRSPDKFYQHPDPPRIWSKMLDEYSARDLTHYEDRLPAISGIASKFASLWGEVYIAGFWRSFLVNQLGWYRVTVNTPYAPFVPFQHLEARGRIGSPSWSWKTAPFPIHITEVVEPAVEVIDCQVTLASATTPFGEVLDGLLSLEAKIIPWTEHQPTWDTNRIKCDYESTELDSTMYLLLLGKASRDVNDRIANIALVVQEMPDGKFERIGSVYDARCDWSSVEPRVVLLV